MNKLFEPTAPNAEDAVAQPTQKQAEKIAYENNKLHKRLCRLTGQAIGDYNMIEEGDKIMVCLSGGKDSYALLDILLTLRERAPINFDIVAVNLDQKQPNFPADVLPAYLEKLGVAYHIETRIPTASSSVSLKRARPLVHSVHACDAAFCTALRANWERPRWRWDIIATIFWKPFFSTCFSAANSRVCLPNCSRTTANKSSSGRWPMSRKPISPAMPRSSNFPSFPAISAAVRKTCSASRSKA